MKVNCPSIVFCPPSAGPTGVDFPISNYSSEEPDGEIFIGFSTGWGHNNPALGTPFVNPNAFVFCLSNQSEEEAQRCARNNWVDQMVNDTIVNTVDGTGGILADGGGAVLNGGTRQQVFQSNFEQCAYTCPDGTQFVWNVNGGYVHASSQAQADSIANSLACRLATAHKICLSALDNRVGCRDSDYFGTIKASTGTLATLPLTWTIQSGSLPPGLSLDTDFGGDPTASQTVGIIGHISAGASGDYTFLLRATDTGGNIMQKSYTLSVLGITNTPTDATQNVPYSFQFAVAGGTAPYTFALTSGTLPTGLSMSSGGLISGTPTGTTGSTFTVGFNDAAGNSCHHDFTINFMSACQALIATMPWPGNANDGNLAVGWVVPGSMGPNLSFTALAPVGTGVQCSIAGSITNTTGAPITIRFTCTLSSPSATQQFSVFDTTLGMAILTRNWPFTGTVFVDLPIANGATHNLQLICIIGGSTTASGSVVITCV
jgi:hypothetical protein